MGMIVNPFVFAGLVQTAIASGTGTAIGRTEISEALTRLANAFDDTTSQTAAQSCTAQYDSRKTMYIGKDWGSGNDKTLTGFDVYGSSDQGFKVSTNPTVTVELLGHTSNDPTAATGLGSTSDTDSNGLKISKLTGLTTTTAYRYHWLKITENSGWDTFIPTAEIVFYEDI